MRHLLLETDVDFDSAMESAPFSVFFEAWNSARLGADIPLRTDIKIQNFSRHVSNMVITEREAHDVFRPRLTGGAVDNRMSGRLTNVNVLDLHCDASRPGTQIMLNALLDTPCGVTTEYSIAYPRGKHVGAQILMLPARGNDGADLILSIQRALGTIRQGPKTDLPIVGEDYSLFQYLDIGNGLPVGLDKKCVLNPKDPSVFADYPDT